METNTIDANVVHVPAHRVREAPHNVKGHEGENLADPQLDAAKELPGRRHGVKEHGDVLGEGARDGEDGVGTPLSRS